MTATFLKWIQHIVYSVIKTRVRIKDIFLFIATVTVSRNEDKSSGYLLSDKTLISDKKTNLNPKGTRE